MATMRYNVARCKEAQGDLRGAQQGYEQVLKDHPDYTDCTIRLGYMKYMCGHKADAEALFKQCLEVPGGREDGLAVLCMIKQRAESWASAKVSSCSLVSVGTSPKASLYMCMVAAPDVQTKWRLPEASPQPCDECVSLMALEFARGQHAMNMRPWQHESPMHLCW